MKKGIAIETVVFAVIAVVALLVIILFYRKVVSTSSGLITDIFHSIRHMFCKSVGKIHYLLPICW